MPQVIECSFDVERRTWLYMRDRPDKLTANHRSVFDKVMTSISDNITVSCCQLHHACHHTCHSFCASYMSQLLCIEWSMR
jgi:hypothetical protein